jgi:poly(A) polymerase
VKAVFRRQAQVIGRRFRLALVRYGRQQLEVSTFRREPTLEERKGRESDSGQMVWSDNEFGTLEEDAYRRDFTVNALYFDPFGKGDGLVDHTGGLADIEARQVRSIGDAATRMEEDPVRMLRACKLAGQYGFSLSPDVAAAIAEHGHLLQACSAARLLEEIYKVIKNAYCLPVFEACHATGLLPELLPALNASRPTGLATLMLPALISELATDERIWRNDDETAALLRTRILEWTQPYPLPRYLSANMRDVLLMLPRFFAADGNYGRLQRNRQFRWGHDLFRTYARVLDDDPGPPPAGAGADQSERHDDREERPRGRRGGRRGGRGRRRRRKSSDS